MGRTMQRDSTSLARLKALDDVKGIAAQLQEAQQLCNHGARAEMILRWLVAKLRSSPEARLHSGSWNLFASCVRLLPVQKIASILGSGAFQEILQAACAEQHLTIQSLHAISSLWKLLHDTSQPASGTAVKSLLRLDGLVAAEISGNWYQHVHMFLESHDTKSAFETDVSLLDFGLQLWSLRRLSSSDDAAFNSRCMSHVCHLVLVLRTRGGHRSAKRKRTSNASGPASDHLRALESSLAQHTVLPTRSSFFAVHHRQAGHKKQKSSHDEHHVAEVFSNLTTEKHSLHEIVPIVLDVALRSVSAQTAGQRSREGPWIEALFDALIALLDGNGHDQRADAITVMLHSLRAQKAALSAQKLLSLASGTIPASMALEDYRWNLIAEIATMNAGILTDPSISKQLFAAIGTRPLYKTETDPLQIQSRIISPLIEAFVRKLQHEELLDLWHTQLVAHAGNQATGVWQAVVPNLAGAISQVVGSAPAITILNQYSALLRDLATSDRDLSGSDVLHRLEADLVVLRTVLLGIRKDVHGAADRQAVNDLWTVVITSASIDAKQLPPTCRRELWQLLSVLSELLLPDHVAAKTDGSDVATMLTEAVSGPVFQAAVEDCKLVSASTPAAKMLMGAVYDLLRRHNSNGESSNVLLQVGELMCAHPESSVYVLTEYPDLVAASPAALRAMVSTSDHDAQQMLVQVATRNVHAGEIDQLLDELSPGQYEALSSAPLSATQRGSIVKKLLHADTIRSFADSPDRYLALLLEHLNNPIDDSQVQGIASILSRLSLLWPAHQPGSVEVDKSLDLLPKIVRAVYRATAAIKTLDKAEVCETAVKHFKQLSDGDVSSNLLAASTIACLEELVGDEDEPYAHREELTLCKLIDDLVSSLESTNVDATGSGRHTSYHAAAEALLLLPDNVWAITAAKRKKFSRRILKTADSILQADLTDANELLAANFRLICRHGDSARVSASAPRILSADLTAKDSRIVQEAYEQAVGTTISTDTIAQILSSATPDTSSTARMHMYATKKVQELSSETLTEYSMADVWRYLLHTLRNSQDLGVRREVLHAITSLLKSGKQVLNQYSLEETLTALQHFLVSESPQVTTDFAQVCAILKVLLNQYRTQLQGRFHLVTNIFQSLLSSLFDGSSVASDRVREWHARLVAKLLEMFCKPVWTRSSASSLVDASREAQKYAGQFVQHILAHYCAQLLSSTSAEVVRTALRPGVFAVIEAMEAFDEGAIRSLSAAINSNERAILRIVVQDWRQFGKWEGL